MKQYLIPKDSRVTIFWFVPELEEEVNIDTKTKREWIIYDNELYKYGSRYLYQISNDLVIEIYLETCVCIETEKIT